MLFFILIMVLLSIFIFANSLYYSLSLLVFILFIIFFIVAHSFIASLTALILSIVYVGAMMILIGYICAICPNVYVEPNNLSLSISFLITSFLRLLLSPYIFITSVSQSTSLVEYFYSFNGFYVFLLIVLILFLTLLIVTSQYLTPKGPFRSLIS